MVTNLFRRSRVRRILLIWQRLQTRGGRLDFETTRR